MMEVGIGFTSDWMRKWRETSDNSEAYLCNQIRVPNDKGRGNAGFANRDLIGLVIEGNWFVFNLSQKVVMKKIKEKLNQVTKDPPLSFRKSDKAFQVWQ